MARQAILIASDNSKSIEFLTAYFSDTQSIHTIIRSKADLSALSSCRPHLLFFQGGWVDQRSIGRLMQCKAAVSSNLKCFSLGSVRHDGFSWDGANDLPIDEKAFRK